MDENIKNEENNVEPESALPGISLAELPPELRTACENAGWESSKAEEHFNQFAPMYEIGSEIDFVLSETIRLRSKYPKVKIAPLLYLVEDNNIYFIKES